MKGKKSIGLKSLLWSSMTSTILMFIAVIMIFCGDPVGGAFSILLTGSLIVLSLFITAVIAIIRNAKKMFIIVNSILLWASNICLAYISTVSTSKSNLGNFSVATPVFCIIVCIVSIALGIAGIVYATQKDGNDVFLQISAILSTVFMLLFAMSSVGSILSFRILRPVDILSLVTFLIINISILLATATMVLITIVKIKDTKEEQE
ncbi:MAG: hypothetical protein LBM03_01005 [Erysipelotrichaceae bacterium]|jgi:hypothetical protein|nr:hypothetical protein [Erysipelotrichaceae bacterium]